MTDYLIEQIGFVRRETEKILDTVKEEIRDHPSRDSWSDDEMRRKSAAILFQISLRLAAGSAGMVLNIQSQKPEETLAEAKEGWELYDGLLKKIRRSCIKVWEKEK